MMKGTMNNKQKREILSYLDILLQLAKDDVIPSAVWEVNQDDIIKLENLIGDVREEIR